MKCHIYQNDKHSTQFVLIVFWITSILFYHRQWAFALEEHLSSQRSFGEIDEIDNFNENSTKSQDNNLDKNNLPSEVQKAVCTVTAGEVRASAEAVTTKTLKGVCGSEEMNLAFHSLEEKLFGELHEIKRLLRELSQLQGFVENKDNALVKLLNKKVLLDQDAPQTITKSTTNTPSSITTTPASFNWRQIPNKRTMYTEYKKTPDLKSFERVKSVIREQEVSQFNNTMLADHDFNLFTYYWKLENITMHIKLGLSVSVESPIFSIKGKKLLLKATFQHLHRDFMYVQLAFAQKNTNSRNNISLDMGGIFKQIKQSNHDVLKHKISILDQNNQHSKDLVSQEFNSLDMGFLIPNSALLDSPYIKNDLLLIQLILYL